LGQRKILISHQETKSNTFDPIVHE